MSLIPLPLVPAVKLSEAGNKIEFAYNSRKKILLKNEGAPTWFWLTKEDVDKMVKLFEDNPDE